MADKRVPARRMMPKWLTFVIGAASGMMAISAVQPADLLKSRMQLVGPAGRNLSAFAVARDIVRNEGVIGNMGLSAALYRQATYNYSTGHLGCFNDMYDMYKATNGNLSLSKKVAMGVVAQGVRAFMGNSTEVAFVGMTADCKLPPQETRNYMNAREMLLPALGVGSPLLTVVLMIFGFITTHPNNVICMCRFLYSKTAHAHRQWRMLMWSGSETINF